MLATRTFVWPTWLSLGISIGFNIIALWLLEELGFSETGTAIIVHATPVYYLVSLLLPVMCCVSDVASMYWKRCEAPHDADLICEEQAGKGSRTVEDIEMDQIRNS
jgi:hypothetical protein